MVILPGILIVLFPSGPHLLTKQDVRWSFQVTSLCTVDLLIQQVQVTVVSECTSIQHAVSFKVCCPVDSHDSSGELECTYVMKLTRW